jgi:hypothetical protein
MNQSISVIISAHLTALDNEMEDLTTVIITAFISLPPAPTVLNEEQKQRYILMKHNQIRLGVLEKRFNRVFARYYPQTVEVLTSPISN